MLIAVFITEMVILHKYVYLLLLLLLSDSSEINESKPSLITCSSDFAA